MAEWKYGRALLLFRREGDSKASRAIFRGRKASRDALSAALKANPNVPDYLLGRRRKVPARSSREPLSTSAPVRPFHPP